MHADLLRDTSVKLPSARSALPKCACLLLLARAHSVAVGGVVICANHLLSFLLFGRSLVQSPILPSFLNFARSVGAKLPNGKRLC